MSLGTIRRQANILVVLKETNKRPFGNSKASRAITFKKMEDENDSARNEGLV